MSADPDFAVDLYQGTADFYDRFRLTYPRVLLDDLLGRAEVSGRGRLMDLACGTGQLAFALHGAFAETWAVDQEPDMIRVVEAKAARDGIAMRATTSSAEQFPAEDGGFELITIGNAFHRLRRDEVARQAFTWLQPGGHIALCWSNSPWAGPAQWQRVLKAVLDRWQNKLAANDRIPQSWDTARRAKPDPVILQEAGFEPANHYEFEVEHRWTPAELAGFVYSTSFLGPAVLGDQVPAFEADLAHALGAYLDDGRFVDRVSYAYDLARKPAR